MKKKDFRSAVTGVVSQFYCFLGDLSLRTFNSCLISILVVNKTVKWTISTRDQIFLGGPGTKHFNPIKKKKERKTRFGFHLQLETGVSLLCQKEKTKTGYCELRRAKHEYNIKFLFTVWREEQTRFYGRRWPTNASLCSFSKIKKYWPRSCGLFDSFYHPLHA